MKKYGLAGGAILVVMALVLIADPLAAIAQGSPAGASIVGLEPVPPPEREVDEARRAGQAWVDKIADIDPELSEWQGAGLTSPQPFHNPTGEVIAYMFAIQREGKPVGRVLVGGSAYGYSILEASQGPPVCIPPRTEVASILTKEQGLDIAEARLAQPKLLLLNILRGFYAVWEVEGQVVGINLVSRDSFVAPRLEDLRSFMPSPAHYKAAKNATSQSLAEMGLLGGEVWQIGLIYRHYKLRGDWPQGWTGITVWCGPASATSIARWKRDVDGDTGLDDSDVMMFQELHEHMDPIFGFTPPGNWVHGFHNYADVHSETFIFRRRWFFGQVMSDIGNSWPLGLAGWMTGPPPDHHQEEKPHWVAVKGFMYRTSPSPPIHQVIVADTWWAESETDLPWYERTANWRVLCWDALLFPARFVYRVADVD